MSGPIDFNPSWPITEINRRSFAGWSFSASGGVGDISGNYVRAYQDAATHMPGNPLNPPYLYTGKLVGLAKGQAGVMINWSNAKLWASFPKTN